MPFHCFGYGSNMDAASLRAKGVVPLASERAVLRGWRLRFNVQHFFPHEGGVGNIEPGDAHDRVCGVLHRLPDDALPKLDAAELYPDGYDRIEVRLDCAGRAAKAIAYVGTPGFVNDACLPTRRYLNILLQGARAAGLDAEYLEALQAQPVMCKPAAPPWIAPIGDYPNMTAAELARHPRCTALDDAVFDMSDARWQHRLLWPQYGGRDMTLHHLRRRDGASGMETEADLLHLCAAQRQYLDEYLHAYHREYRYVARFARR